MSYAYVAIALVCIYAVWVYFSIRSDRKNSLDKIRHDWGRPKSDYFPFHHISLYAELQKQKFFHQLSEQTLRDIDFQELFQFIDRTTTRPGQQYLYNKLIRPSGNINELETLNSQVKFFTNHTGTRESVQQDLLALSNSDAYHLSALLRNQLLKRPKWLKWLVADTMVVVLLLLLTPFYNVIALFLLIPATLNMVLHFWNKGNTDSFTKSFPQLHVLIRLSEKLLQKELPHPKDKVAQAIAALKPFQSKIKLLSLGQGGSVKDDLAQIGTYFVDLIKAFLLVEIHVLYHLTKELEDKQHHIATLFEYVGNIDLTISVASLRAEGKEVCVPQFIAPHKKISSKNIYHPLIKKCVTNTISVHTKSVLITGSNMSGKTTFLRTLIINSVLAQTICTCFAEAFTTPILKQFSSIRIDDDLLKGSSYYFEEINIMNSLVKEVNSGHQNLFVSDEVFKGTNTIERIASAKAILSYLNKGDNLVFVSTHDVELSGMLGSEYDLYHFTETIEEDQLHFDHRLKAGPLTTRNAIRLLELSHYPDEITREANRISSQLTNQQQIGL